ncbi:hypothetical protein SSX86_020241 [Deinandra increscens subsp. villosa]|uniref:Uncharacterized protein n=1 Tax=Deinandra increscens subsp. villosa TaxID=3103831 RepID=A0AAP0CSN5_9ASTR
MDLGNNDALLVYGNDDYMGKVTDLEEADIEANTTVLRMTLEAPGSLTVVVSLPFYSPWSMALFATPHRLPFISDCIAASALSSIHYALVEDGFVCYHPWSWFRQKDDGVLKLYVSASSLFPSSSISSKPGYTPVGGRVI